MFSEQAGMDWDAVLQKRLTVIRGEPGCGKTQELRAKSQALQQSGQDAFFLRLESIKKAGVEQALSEAAPAFNTWLTTEKPAVFFLDAVDETRLEKQSDFGGTLQVFKQAVSRCAPHRISLVISSRIQSWRPHEDERDLLALFTLPPTNDRSGNRLPDADEEKVQVLDLLPLDAAQVKAFAMHRGLAEQELAAFVAALDARSLWSFASRPLDVEWLVSYWLLHGCFGTLTEMIASGAEQRLKETRDKSLSDVLSPEQALKGAQSLAAACLFCKQFSFTVSASTEATGLNAASCLPGSWTPRQIHALLDRALFDPAAYGSVGFHHRQVLEYLAAQWLSSRVDAQGSIRELEDLLCARIDTARVLRPHLLPLTAWLAAGDRPWNHSVRAWILEAQPELHFHHGDAESLPLNYRHDLLQSYITRQPAQGQVWLALDRPSLKRFAHPDLAPALNRWLLDPALNEAVKEDLLWLCSEGYLQACLPTALQLLAAPATSLHLKQYVLLFIEKAGDTAQKRAAYHTILLWPVLDASIAGVAARLLLPPVLTTTEFLALLDLIVDVPTRSWGLAELLPSHIREELPSEHAKDVLMGMMARLATPPYVSVDPPRRVAVSVRWQWLRPSAAAVLLKLVSMGDQTAASSQHIAENLWRLQKMDFNRDGRDELEPLHKAVAERVDLRRAYYWHCVTQHRARNKAVGDAWLFELLGFNERWQSSAQDLKWLLDDALTMPTPDERKQALHTAMEIVSQHRHHWPALWRLRAVLWQPLLRGKYLDQVRLLLWGRPYYRLKHWFQQGYRWQQWLRKIRRLRVRTYDFWWLRTHLAHLREARNLHALSRLTFEAAERQAHTRSTPENWQNAIRRWGLPIARAAQQGCKTFWPQFTPLLPHEKADPSRGDGRIPVGLAGIAAALQDGELRFSDLNAKDANTAFRYAFNEINSHPPWLAALAESQPQVAHTVWRECIAGEWQIPATRSHVYEVLAHLRQAGGSLAEATAPLVLAALQQSDPLHHDVLQDSLRLLCGNKRPPRAELTALAALRTPLALDQPIQHRLWLAIWLQTDALAALAYLRLFLKTQTNPTEWMAGFCAGFGGRFNSNTPLLPDADCHALPALNEYLLLVCEWLRFDEDTQHESGVVYTPTYRDDAQQLRDALLGRLAEQATAEAAHAMQQLAIHPLFAARADWIRHLIQQQQRKRADTVAWQPQDVALFEREGGHTPRNSYELFLAVVRHLEAIKQEVEQGNLGWRADALGVHETVIRRWFADKLKLKARMLYTVSEESVARDEKEMDICLQVPGMEGQVPIELKWENNWTVNEMKERMSNQLAGQYLRAPHCHYGIFLIAKRPTDNVRPDFELLLAELREHAKTVPQQFPNVRQIIVMGIDLTRP
ncbi:MAG: hypothetical protein Q7J29_08025 [Stagnimonas sp.]|nr:hypothetical protein [Stagnimonas sp.]